MVLMQFLAYFTVGKCRQKNECFSARFGTKLCIQGGPRGGMCPPLLWGFEGGVSPLAVWKNLGSYSLAKCLNKKLRLAQHDTTAQSRTLFIWGPMWIENCNCLKNMVD